MSLRISKRKKIELSIYCSNCMNRFTYTVYRNKRKLGYDYYSKKRFCSPECNRKHFEKIKNKVCDKEKTHRELLRRLKYVENLKNKKSPFNI